jgi:hypothetical protein
VAGERPTGPAPFIIDAALVLDSQSLSERVDAIASCCSYGIITIPLRRKGACCGGGGARALFTSGRASPDVEVRVASW